MSAITILSGAAIEQAINSPAGLPAVAIAEPIWREAGGEHDPRARLKGIWSIGGLSLHVIALAVHIDEQRETMELDESVEGYDIGELWSAHGMEGYAETADINGRHYLIFASPFCT